MLTRNDRNAASAVLITLMASLACQPAHAQITFRHEFAPQDGLVAPMERANRAEICLNGSWAFQPQALPADYKQGKDPVPTLKPADAGTWEKTKVKVPSPWNVNAFPDQKGLGGDFRCYPSYPDDWKNVSMGWLRRSFTVPAAWKGKRLLLHFAAVAGDAQAVVNGKVVGQHSDIFLPFDVDVTNAVQLGADNKVMVGVRKMSLSEGQGKYGRRTYQGGSMWGQAIAGIWQDVFLEAVPAVHVADVFVRPLVDQGKLEADVTVQNDTDSPANVSVAGSAYRWISESGKDVVSAPEPKWKLASNAALATDSKSESIPAHGSVIVTLTADATGKLDLWSPEHPNLYGLVCSVTGTGAADTKYTRFGWRQITFRGSDVLLNGGKLIMKGDSWHFLGIPEMTRRYAWAWYRTLKDAHLNAVRLHAEPYPSFFLDVADEQGILVLDEDAVWASDGGPKIDDDHFWKDTEPHLSNLILRDRNHPSVFGWSISNELMAVVRGVFHAPKEYQDEVIRYDGIWASICRELDPTRVWISADGEDDAAGHLPTYIVHYGGSEALKRAGNSGKPWGVGEAGPAYYGSPAQIAEQASDPRAYLSFADRMEGVAVVSYQSLADQIKYGASYRSVFNLVWYGLKPLELGMSDTTRSPALTDGVFFPPFVEGKPGVQPERLGPYCTTLNPGYDPKLPMYATWPLFDAIKDAAAEPPITYKPDRPLAFDAGTAKPASEGAIKRVTVLAGAGGTLSKNLGELGVPVSGGGESSDCPLVFIDGAQPPSADAKATIGKTLDLGGTVFVWGANAATLGALNALLPQPLELTARNASSLSPGASDPLIAGITPASLYFSELSPSTILPTGLDGPLLKGAKTLLSASNTDWMRWNRQAETTKTAMVLRSERETKPSGIALVEVKSGKGRILVCNIPAAAQTSQAVALNRTLLANLGIALGDAAGQRNILNAQGMVTRALGIGLYSATTVEEATEDNIVAPNSGGAITIGASVKDRTWTSVTADTKGAFDRHALRDVRPEQTSIVYFSFWLFSPKALDNLLLDPHLPNLDLTVGAVSNVQTWLNGKSFAAHAAADGKFVVPTLLLQQGWNHILVKVVRAGGDAVVATGSLSLVLSSSQPDYLTQIRGAQEKPW